MDGYIIYLNGEEVNRIIADQEFCERYYSKNGYSYAAIVDKVSETQPAESESRISYSDISTAMKEAINSV